MKHEKELNLYAYRISTTELENERRLVVYDKTYHDLVSKNPETSKEFIEEIEKGKLTKEYLRRYPDFPDSQIRLLSSNIPNLYNKKDIFVGQTLLGFSANFKGKIIDDFLESQTDRLIVRYQNEVHSF